MTDSNDQLRETEQAAMRYLARREYGRLELRRKLLQRHFVEGLVDTALDSLEQRGYLSDSRFVELVVRSRIAGLYGPVRIRHELGQKGIREQLIEAELQARRPDWQSLAKQAKIKRFGEEQSEDFQLLAKQKRYLLNRGFQHEHIRSAFSAE